MVDGSLRSTAFHVFTAAKMEEINWLETVMTALKKDHLDKNDKKDWISWSAYHARIQEAIIPPAAINALLPLFLVVQHLNPGQVLVLAIDQPLFALPKQSMASEPGQMHWERTTSSLCLVGYT